MTGLSHNSLYRLRDLFQNLPSKYTDILEKLKTIVHYDQNYRCYAIP